MSSLLKSPSKAESAILDPFSGLTLDHIVVPKTRSQFIAAAEELLRHRFVGFDTESKPTFKTGEVSGGPHIAQFSTLDRAYIFQLHHADSHAVLAQLMESADLVKVGFGLKSDRGHLRRKFGIEPKAILDLNVLFKSEGYHAEIGVRAAVAVMLNQRFQKSKHVTTSNWSLPQLTANQLLYAANDAYAAIRVLHALDKPEAELPITGVSSAQNQE